MKACFSLIILFIFLCSCNKKDTRYIKELVKNKKYTEAIPLLDTAIAHEKLSVKESKWHNLIELSWLLYKCDYELGNYSHAKDDLLYLREIGSISGALFVDLGTVYIYLDDIESALLYLESAHTVDKNLPLVNMDLAICYESLFQNSKALSYINYEIVLDSSNVKARQIKSEILNRLKKYEEAIKETDTLLAQDAGNSAAYYYRGVAFHHLNDEQNAIKNFTTAIQLNPNISIFYLERAVSYNRLNDQWLVLDDLNKAIHISPSDVSLYFLRAVCYKNLKMYNRACRDIQQIKRLNKYVVLSYLIKDLDCNVYDSSKLENSASFLYKLSGAE